MVLAQDSRSTHVDNSVGQRQGAGHNAQGPACRLGIHAGSLLAFRIAADGRLNVQVLAKGSDALFGLMGKPGEPARSLDEMDAAVDAIARKRARRVR